MPTYVEQLCPRCGAPLPNTTATGLMHCEYCSTPLVPSHGAFRLVKEREDELTEPELERLWIGGRRYAVLGRLSRGEGSDVFLARWDQRISERVVLKVLRDETDRGLLDNEWDVLSRLQGATHQGRDHFTRLLPQPIAHGKARLGVQGTEGTCQVSVFRYASGFIHTLDDVFTAYPHGISAQASVWIWKRIVETLAWVHSTGHVHGAILPEHLLMHARDHGIRLIGWSRSVRNRSPLAAVTNNRRNFYPLDVWKGGDATPETDLAMSARCMHWLMSGDPAKASSDAPKSYANLLRQCAEGNTTGSGWDVLEEISSVAKDNYGPPKYVPFDMPGWGANT